jgi:hypothetical protein
MVCVANGLPQFGPCVIRVSGAGPCRAGAIWGLERSAEWMREEQPEVKPYCACESCACCGSVAVRGGGERAWPGAGQCEGRAGPLPGRVRASARGGPSHCLPGARVLRAAGVRGDFGPGPVVISYRPNRVCEKPKGWWVGAKNENLLTTTKDLRPFRAVCKFRKESVIATMSKRLD